jgi:hypothetical protein
MKHSNVQKFCKFTGPYSTCNIWELLQAKSITVSLLSGQKWYQKSLVLAHLTAMQKSGIRIRLLQSPAHGKLCQSLGGLPPGIAEYRVLASEWLQRYVKKCHKKPWKHLGKNTSEVLEIPEISRLWNKQQKAKVTALPIKHLNSTSYLMKRYFLLERYTYLYVQIC